MLRTSWEVFGILLFWIEILTNFANFWKKIHQILDVTKLEEKKKKKDRCRGDPSCLYEFT
jgi:hypothetical protein